MSQDNEKTESLLAEIWQKHLPTLHERLDLLDQVAAQASTGPLPERSRLTAQSIAHKLSGNLGMFGHHQASEIASSIEHLLKTPTPDLFTHLTELTRDLRNVLLPAL